MAQKFLTPIDLSRLELQNVKFQNVTSFPTVVAGDESLFVYRVDLHEPFYYSGNPALGTNGWVSMAHVQIPDGSITSAKIADGTIQTVDIANAAITSGLLAADSVTSAAIADAAVGNTELAANAVTTAKILDDNVTFAKLADKTIPRPTTLPTTKNYTLIYDGTNVVWAPQGTTFTFSNQAFSAGDGDTIGATNSRLIGSGVWKAVGALSFTAAYNNGPATSANVTSNAAGFGTLALTGANRTGPTLNTVAVNYPAAVGNTVTFTLSSAAGVETDTDTNTFSFINNRYFGVSTKASGFTSADVVALTAELSNSGSKTFSVTANAGQYIVFASRVALGTRTFTVGGFTGGFQPPETVTVTNANGFAETYYVYRSTNAALGATTVVVS